MEFTKERLLKIQSWSETYGPGSNVVLPAEEAEGLARIALASLEADPIYQLWDEGFYDTEKEIYDAVVNADGAGSRGRIVYTAPPAPVLPVEISDIIKRFQYQADHLSDWHHIDEHSCKVNRRDLMTVLEFMTSCRAAMLQEDKS